MLAARLLPPLRHADTITLITPPPRHTICHMPLRFDTPRYFAAAATLR